MSLTRMEKAQSIRRPDLNKVVSLAYPKNSIDDFSKSVGARKILLKTFKSLKTIKTLTEENMQTLTRERKQKFTEILEQFKDKLTQAEIEATAELLAEASISRSERKTDETKGEYNTNTPKGTQQPKPDLIDYLLAQDKEQLPIEHAITAFESAFGISRPWDWYPAKTSDEPTWRDFRNWIAKKYQADHECFTKYVTWRNQKYSKGTMSNLAIKQRPYDFPDSWDMYLASESMYGQPATLRSALAALTFEESNVNP